MAPSAVFLAPGAYRVQLVAIHQRPQPLRLAVAADHHLGVDREGEAALPCETSCLTLLWAVLDLYITNATNRTKFAQLDRQRLKRMRYECIDLPELLRSGTASGTRTRAADETENDRPRSRRSR